MQHAGKILEDKILLIILLKTMQMSSGRDIYLYLAVRVDMLDKFDKAVKSNDFDPEDYGAVLDWGYGEPTDEAKRLLEQCYGFNHDNVIEFKDKIAVKITTENTSE